MTLPKYNGPADGLTPKRDTSHESNQIQNKNFELLQKYDTNLITLNLNQQFAIIVGETHNPFIQIQM